MWIWFRYASLSTFLSNENFYMLCLWWNSWSLQDFGTHRDCTFNSLIKVAIPCDLLDNVWSRECRASWLIAGNIYSEVLFTSSPGITLRCFDFRCHQEHLKRDDLIQKDETRHMVLGFTLFLAELLTNMKVSVVLTHCVYFLPSRVSFQIFLFV